MDAMNRFKQVQLTAILCALLVFTSVAVSTNMPADAGARAAASALVKGAQIPVLVTTQGLTLYMYTADKKNQSTCTGECAKFWPPLALASGAKTASSVAGIQGTFAVAKSTGGSRQVTFNGSPLYTFAKDKKPGDMNGEGIGGVWWAVTVPGGHAAANVAAAPPVKLAMADMLVTARGLTLYTFTQDKKNQSTCTGQCAKFWPPLLAGSGNTAPTAVAGFSGAFGLAAQAGGKQITYNGSPLYTFVKDKKPGDVFGQGAGGTWWMVLAPAGSATASLVKTSAAQILVTAGGMTLYLFTADKKNQNTCTGDCAKFWPPLVLASGTEAPANTAAFGGVFGTAPLADGSMQLTFDGAPLYTFANDKKPGDINGQGVAGTWWTVVVPGTQGAGVSHALSEVKTATIQIMVTAQGMTLYVLSTDKKNQSTCTGACAKFWPPLLLVRGAKAPATIKGISGVFGVAPLAGGNKQLTYAGAPLYTFVKDKKPGDMNGQGVAGTWWIAAPAGQTSSAAGAQPLASTSTATTIPTATATAAPTSTAPAAATASATSVPAPPTATSTPVQMAPPTSTPYPGY